MLIPHESLEEMRERHKRELTAFRKQLRRERWSLFAFLTAWTLFICILPFTTSPEQIIVMLSIFTLFYLQFVFVMVMD